LLKITDLNCNKKNLKKVIKVIRTNKRGREAGFKESIYQLGVLKEGF